MKNVPLYASPIALEAIAAALEDRAVYLEDHGRNDLNYDELMQARAALDEARAIVTCALTATAWKTHNV
jgi:hypothetical protein